MIVEFCSRRTWAVFGVVCLAVSLIGCQRNQQQSQPAPQADSVAEDNTATAAQSQPPTVSQDSPSADSLAPSATNLRSDAAPPTAVATTETADESESEKSELGEKILTAEESPDDAPLRPAKGATIYKLSNLRVGHPGPGPWPKVMVHYERISGQERGTGPTLVMRTPDGNERKAQGGFGPFDGWRKAGDLVVDLGFGGPGSGAPKNLEVYLVHTDRRWEGEDFHPKFKVSNSIVIGDMGRELQYAREWKADEAEKLNNPPPEAPQVNTNANVGEDTPFVGDTEGRLPPARYADPGKRPVLGVLYLTGQGKGKEGEKIKCLVQFMPSYDARQPRYRLQAVMAKSGYALGGLNLKTNKIVTAVQAIFMKLKSDGTLDTSDQYTSSWLGQPGENDEEGQVITDGRKVIGMHLKHFGALHAVALVLE